MSTGGGRAETRNLWIPTPLACRPPGRTVESGGVDLLPPRRPVNNVDIHSSPGGSWGGQTRSTVHARKCRRKSVRFVVLCKNPEKSGQNLVSEPRPSPTLQFSRHPKDASRCSRSYTNGESELDPTSCSQHIVFTRGGPPFVCGRRPPTMC